VQIPLLAGALDRPAFDRTQLCLFDNFAIESENGVLVLHPKDGFGSFSIAIIVTANSPRIWRFLSRLDRECSSLFAAKN